MSTGRATALLILVAMLLLGCGREDQDANLLCDESSSLILAAQAVPAAAAVPCVDGMPAGWSIGSTTYENDRIEIAFESRRAPIDDMTLHFDQECDTGGATALEGEPPFGVPAGSVVLTDQRSFAAGVTFHMYVVARNTCTTIDIELETSEVVTAEDFPNLAWISRDVIARLVADDTDGRVSLDP